MTVKNRIVAFATVILLSLTIASCGKDNTSDSNVAEDENVMKGNVGKTYQLEDKYEFSVVSYKYYHHADSDKYYLSVNVDFKNIDTDSVLLYDAVSGKLTYKDKYNYDMDINSNESNPCINTDGDYAHKIREDLELDPLDSRDFYYNFDIPDEGIEDGEIIKLSVTVLGDKYEYSLEKNEENTKEKVSNKIELAKK